MSLFMQHYAAVHIKLAWRGGQTVLAVSFLFIAVTLLPFGLGPELKLLRALAPGLLWVVLAISLLTTLDRLFQADFEDGTLDRLRLLPLPFEAALLAKLSGHFLALVLPLILSVPLAGLLLNIDGARSATFIGRHVMRRTGFGDVGRHWRRPCRQRATRRPVDGAYCHAVLCAGADCRRRGQPSGAERAARPYGPIWVFWRR